MFKREQIENMTLQELLDNQIELNKELVKQILENPVIRDAPELASLYGFYSRFIIGQKKAFFVFGTDADVINGKFHEFEDTVIPDYVVKKCGYFVPNKMDMRCPRCTAYEIGKYSAQAIGNGMEIMEFLIHEYKFHNLPVPEYILSGTNEYIELCRLNQVSDNKTLENNSGKAFFKNRECRYLLDLAVWEYPITPRGKKPGILAFSACSRYSLHTADIRKTTNLYNSPSRWEATLQSESLINYRSSISEPKEIIDFVSRGLKEMGIPYFILKKDKKIQRVNQIENSMLKETMPYFIANPELVTLYTDRTDEGALIYWLLKYAETQFTQEQLDYGRELYYGLMNPEDSSQEPAAYLFFLPPNGIYEFITAANKCQIKIGYPDADWLKRSFELGVYLITEYSNMPIVNDILHGLSFFMFSRHSFGIDGNTNIEYRTLHQNRISAYIKKDEYQYQKGNHFMRLIPWCVSRAELLKRGVMVDNNNPPLKAPVDSHKERRKVVLKNQTGNSGCLLSDMKAAFTKKGDS